MNAETTTHVSAQTDLVESDGIRFAATALCLEPVARSPQSHGSNR
ncbi:MAG: hypothetical protein JWM85_1071 [Acidimicrobiaceae bacterium]|nr:hypothetical protein [Acidimicrobiaceae bacterium]